jgi:hypothetical protein
MLKARGGEYAGGQEHERREKLKLTVKTLRKHAHEGESVTERFKREYPFLREIMEEWLLLLLRVARVLWSM